MASKSQNYRNLLHFAKLNPLHGASADEVRHFAGRPLRQREPVRALPFAAFGPAALGPPRRGRHFSGAFSLPRNAGARRCLKRSFSALAASLCSTTCMEGWAIAAVSFLSDSSSFPPQASEPPNSLWFVNHTESGRFPSSNYPRLRFILLIQDSKEYSTG